MAKKRRKQQQPTEKNGSDSDIEDHPDTNALNKSLNQLYMANKNKFSTPKNKELTATEEMIEEAEANKEIDKSLKKRVRLKERYSYDAKGSFDDLGGLDDVISNCKKFLDFEKRDPVLRDLGFDTCRRLLISGVSGVGKSKLVEALINYSGMPSLKVTMARLQSGAPNEVDSAFRNCLNYAESLSPCIVVMDKLEKIAPKRDDNRNLERDKLTDHMLDSLEEFNNKEDHGIILIGVTNKTDGVDPDFMMAARFNKRIEIDVPNDKARSAILRVLCRNLKVSEDVDFDELGFMSPGYVGADLRDLVQEAGSIAVDRLVNLEGSTLTNGRNESDDHAMEDQSQTPKNVITKDDFFRAFRHIKPSLKRDGFASIPPVTWDDIGACELIRKKLLTSILFPVKYSSFMSSTLWDKSCGILLHGPPGCGKTSIAKALANEGGINFISVKGPEILNMYVGESERRIRAIFEKASKAKPCVIFFDEIDALCSERSSSEKSNVTQSVLSQLLTEMDGFDNQSCKVLATTNRLDVLDSALLRPGRFDTIIYVGIPNQNAKFEILKTITRNGRPPLDTGVDIKALSKDPRLKNFSGADLRGLIERAHSIATIEMYENLGGNLRASDFSIKNHHIEIALKERGASVSDSQLSYYIKSAHQIEENK